MTQVHAIGHTVVLVAATGCAALGIAIAMLETVPRHTHAASLVVLAAVAFTATTGILSVGTGSRPNEGLHWVYGAAMLLGLLAGIGLGTTMAPRSRGLVMLATGLVLFLLAFRLADTG